MVGFDKGVGSMADGELQMIDQRVSCECRKRRSSIQHGVLLIGREGQEVLPFVWEFHVDRLWGHRALFLGKIVCHDLVVCRLPWLVWVILLFGRCALGRWLFPRAVTAFLRR